MGRERIERGPRRGVEENEIYQKKGVTALQATQNIAAVLTELRKNRLGWMQTIIQTESVLLSQWEEDVRRFLNAVEGFVRRMQKEGENPEALIREVKQQVSEVYSTVEKFSQLLWEMLSHARVVLQLLEAEAAKGDASCGGEEGRGKLRHQELVDRIRQVNEKVEAFDSLYQRVGHAVALLRREGIL